MALPKSVESEIKALEEMIRKAIVRLDRIIQAEKDRNEKQKNTKAA